MVVTNIRYAFYLILPLKHYGTRPVALIFALSCQCLWIVVPLPSFSFQALRDSASGFGWNINPYFCHCYCCSRWQLLLVRHQHITYLQKVLSFIISFFLFSFTFTKDKRKNVIWSFIFCKTAHLWTLCEALIICHCNYECQLSNMPFQRKSCGGNCVQYVLIKQLVCNAVSTTCL